MRMRRTPFVLQLDGGRGSERLNWAADNRALRSFLHGLFLRDSFLFVGCAPGEIHNFVRAIGAAKPSVRHFALLGSQSNEPRDFLATHNITPVDPGPSTRPFFVDLANRVRHIQSRPRLAGVAGTTPELRALILEDVGPFKNQRIEVCPGWNILLGNNAVGKSSVIKAVAAAIAGSDASPWAGRLIRSGASRGVITLETSGATYRTTLHRKTGGLSAEVESEPIGVRDGEDWLVLGFPALRTITLNSPNDLFEGSLIPTAEDVLPLVRGEADPRLDNLKRWIVSLDYRISKGEQVRPLLDDFFAKMSELLEGVPIRFDRVDERSRQVFVVTDDGSVPIDQISQGSASLASWVGVIVQRCHEVYGGGVTAGYRPTLVLMDEIDAHMHPSWQQTLIGNLERIFPGVQFVVTTHSPLIVGGRSNEEILLFQRDEHTREIRVRRPGMDFRALRADQILTSPAFGLEGARDWETVGKQRRYGDLLNRASLTPEEQAEMEALSADFDVTAPPAAEWLRIEALLRKNGGTPAGDPDGQRRLEQAGRDIAAALGELDG